MFLFFCLCNPGGSASSGNITSVFQPFSPGKRYLSQRCPASPGGFRVFYTHLCTLPSRCSFSFLLGQRSHQRPLAGCFRRGDCRPAGPEELVAFLHAVIWIHPKFLGGMCERQLPPLHCRRCRTQRFLKPANSDSHRSRRVCVLFYFFLEDVPGGRFGRVSLMLRRRFMSPDPAAPEPDGAPPPSPK